MTPQEQKRYDELMASCSHAVANAFALDDARIRAEDEREAFRRALEAMIALWEQTEHAQWGEPECVSTAKALVSRVTLPARST
jgi:hypothetical protein